MHCDALLTMHMHGGLMLHKKWYFTCICFNLHFTMLSHSQHVLKYVECFVCRSACKDSSKSHTATIIPHPMPKLYPTCQHHLNCVTFLKV